jgi:hypothetical protein
MTTKGPPESVPTATRDFERKTFGPGQRRTIHALAEALFTDPEDPDPHADAHLAWVVEDADKLLSHGSTQLRVGMHATLVLLEVLPLFVIGRFARCSSLPREDRVRYLQQLEAARITQLALLVVLWKTLLTIVWFEHPDMAPQLGHDHVHTRFRRSHAA